MGGELQSAAQFRGIPAALSGASEHWREPAGQFTEGKLGIEAVV
jgi:hypothetical protein